MPAPNPSLDEDDLTYKPGGAAIAALTDNSGGTASDTLVDVPATYTEATLANHVASLAAKINAIRTALINANIIQQD